MPSASPFSCSNSGQPNKRNRPSYNLRRALKHLTIVKSSLLAGSPKRMTLVSWTSAVLIMLWDSQGREGQFSKLAVVWRTITKGQWVLNMVTLYYVLEHMDPFTKMSPLKDQMFSSGLLEYDQTLQSEKRYRLQSEKDAGCQGWGLYFCLFPFMRRTYSFCPILDLVNFTVHIHYIHLHISRVWYFHCPRGS